MQSLRSQAELEQLAIRGSPSRAKQELDFLKSMKQSKAMKIGSSSLEREASSSGVASPARSNQKSSAQLEYVPLPRARHDTGDISNLVGEIRRRIDESKQAEKM